MRATFLRCCRGSRSCGAAGGHVPAVPQGTTFLRCSRGAHIPAVFQGITLLLCFLLSCTMSSIFLYYYTYIVRVTNPACVYPLPHLYLISSCDLSPRPLVSAFLPLCTPPTTSISTASRDLSLCMILSLLSHYLYICSLYPLHPLPQAVSSRSLTHADPRETPSPENYILSIFSSAWKHRWK